ncbi:glycosyltransferase family 4 protein [bacterium]|nr:glycosyltransferase family 4 protein [candidate division CSSED10-310 bacterium]
MKLGFVVQRYGMKISGGAELHCRLIAEHLSKKYPVEVFTTCARDYITWRNEYAPGTSTVNGVTIHRFPVKRTRSSRRFFDVQNLVFYDRQSLEMQNRWIEENGPYCPRLISAVSRRKDIESWILFSYRYWTTVQALRILSGRSFLVPTAEHDPALYLDVFKEIFNLPAGIIYNAPEEKQLVESIAHNQTVPNDVVGVGVLETPLPGPDRVKTKFGDRQPYILYLGRIDKNKGCDHLFRYFTRFTREIRGDIRLLLAGNAVMPIPEKPNIHHLGFVSDEDKTCALMGACALVMPSQYESLSMVLLEAWRCGRPVLVNAACEVLLGQCIRSNGGLPYRGYEEFAHSLQLLVDNRSLADRLGVQGRNYYIRNYSWDIIEKKYENLLIPCRSGER